MPRAFTLLCWLLILATATTGLVSAGMEYLLEPSDPFSAFNHPWQPHLDTAHALLGPALAVWIGFVLGDHARPRFRSGGPKRKSGLLLSTLAVLLVLSGGFLSAFGSPDALAYKWAHGILGSLFTLLFAGHALSVVRARWKARAPGAGSSR